MMVAYNDVTHAQRDFVNKALFTCGSDQPISLETLVLMYSLRFTHVNPNTIWTDLNSRSLCSENLKFDTDDK